MILEIHYKQILLQLKEIQRQAEKVKEMGPLGTYRGQRILRDAESIQLTIETLLSVINDV